MLSDNSNKIRQVKGTHLLNAGGKKGRPRLLHNGINGQKGGKNAKGTPAKPGIVNQGDQISLAASALRKKRK